jgi:hypothetical protein
MPALKGGILFLSEKKVKDRAYEDADVVVEASS